MGYGIGGRWTIKTDGTEVENSATHPSRVLPGLQQCHDGVILYKRGCRLVPKRINYSNITGAYLVLLSYPVLGEQRKNSVVPEFSSW